MLNGYRILDVDGHVVEPVDMWAKYLDPEFKSRAPVCDSSEEAGLVDRVTRFGMKGILNNPVKGLKVDGQEIVNKISDQVWAEGTWAMATNYTDAAVRGFNAESQVMMMKRMGIDMTFLYPTVGLWMFAVDSMDPRLAAALVRAYNDWLRDFANHDPELMKCVGAISRHDPEDMVSELHRVAGFGWRAVFLRPNPVRGRLLSDPAYETFWSECERLNIAVAIHEGTHCRLQATGADRFNTRFAMHACSHPMEQMMALLALIEGGVLERHPALRVAFLEAGCGWLPYWLWRLDELEYKNLDWEVKDRISMKPSEYFRRQCFVSVEPGEPYLDRIIDFIGEDKLLFGCDYPHMDHKPDVVEELLEFEEKLPRETIQKILWDNPRRFYGLTD
jgi:predicted TIM-barrel fold metal-dependent hydrolase